MDEAAAPPPVLRTDRLVLRPLAPADAADLAAVIARDREHLAPWIALPADHASITPWIARRRESRERITWIVRTADDDTLAGCVTLTLASETTATLGYWLAAPFVGRGLAREAVGEIARAALAFADEVAIDCARANTRSAAVARAIGFARTTQHADRERWTLTSARARTWDAVMRAAAPLGEPRVSTDGRTVSVAFEGTTVDIALEHRTGAPHVVASADICAAALINARACLEHNDTLAIGSLAARGDRLRLRHACAPDRVATLDLALLAREAARLARVATTLPAAHEAFAFLI